MRALREILPPPGAPGRFGPFGGAYVPELLVPALARLRESVDRHLAEPAFAAELERELASWVGRPTPLTRARRLGARLGVELWLKREDLAHTGAHKINNALGQVLLARRSGSRRVVAETGAGQHGVATAAACARVGLPCRVFMGAVDARRQAPNVRRMRLFGAEVVVVEEGQATLRAAIDEALREWSRDPEGTAYVIGSAVGPHPYPRLVRELQSVIGREARAQLLAEAGGLPDLVVACVGGGSNALGLFTAFLDDEVHLVGAEAAGRGDAPGEHAASVRHGRPGILHGALSLFLQDEHGQIADTHSVSAGLDYPGVGPELAFLATTGRVSFRGVRDEAALAALAELSALEGVLPALESAHALAAAAELAREHGGARVLVSCSGRGDKDLELLAGLERGEPGGEP